MCQALRVLMVKESKDPPGGKGQFFNFRFRDTDTETRSESSIPCVYDGPNALSGDRITVFTRKTIKIRLQMKHKRQSEVLHREYYVQMSFRGG